MNHILRLSLLLVVLSVAMQVFGQDKVGDSSPAVAPAIAAQALDRGHLDGVDYVNNFFGLSFAVPDNWTVLSAQRSDAVVSESRKMLSGDEKKTAQINESVERSVVLLSLKKLPSGSPENAAFMLVAERLPAPSVKTGVDVIDLMKKAFEGTNFSIEFQGDVRTERIGEADFAIATVKNTSPVGSFMQKMYITTKSGYALEFFYTYQVDADLSTFDSMIKTIKVK